MAFNRKLVNELHARGSSTTDEEQMKLSPEAAQLFGELLRMYTMEAAERATGEATSRLDTDGRGPIVVEVEDLQRILVQLLLDFS